MEEKGRMEWDGREKDGVEEMELDERNGMESCDERDRMEQKR